MDSQGRPLTVYPFNELVALARAQTPFYQNLYADLPARPALTDLPVIDQASFWEAHHRDAREVLSEPLTSGFVLNSGGSTGAPKYSYANDEERDSAVALEARALAATGLKDGQRVANLFGSGHLYSSFSLVQESLSAIPAKVLQLPIGGYHTPIPDCVRLLRRFQVNVLVGVPTHLMNLLNYMEKEGVTDVPITHFLFAGEPFTHVQRQYMHAMYPSAEVRSIGYASVDAGMVGYADLQCGPGEHRNFDRATVVEIIDEDNGEIIEEPERPGKIVFTNLTRRLMPILRYPTGDRAQWQEPAGGVERKFLLLGRSEESARLSSFNVPVAEIEAMLEPFRGPYGIRQFQLVITQEDHRDLLILRLASSQPPALLRVGSDEILAAFDRLKPVVADFVAKGLVNPVRVEWVGPENLETNQRTGKTRRVVDRRSTSA